MNDNNRTLLLVDANNTGMMAFGRTPLKHKGLRTEVLSISLAMVRRYLTNFCPDEVCFIYDGGRDERRTSIYPAYKRRPKPPLTAMEIKERRCFFRQLDIFRENMYRLGFKQIKCRGREADDVIYSVAVEALEDGKFSKIVVVSSDKDMFQLFIHFGDKVAVYNPIRDVLYDSATAAAALGASQYIAYRSMVGDAGDNLPGVKGLGPKKAARILEIMGNTGEELSVADQKLLYILEDNEKEFELMRVLITFMHIDQEEIKRGTRQITLHPLERLESLMRMCQRYGMQQFLNDLPSASASFFQYWQREAGEART